MVVAGSHGDPRIVFTGLLLNQWHRRRKSHQLAWTVGLFMYGTAAAMESYSEFTGGWIPWVYRIYIVLAASLVGFLGLGTLYLISRNRLWPRLYLAFILVCLVVFFWGAFTVDLLEDELVAGIVMGGQALGPGRHDRRPLRGRDGSLGAATGGLPHGEDAPEEGAGRCRSRADTTGRGVRGRGLTKRYAKSVSARIETSRRFPSHAAAAVARPTPAAIRSQSSSGDVRASYTARDDSGVAPVNLLRTDCAVMRWVTTHTAGAAPASATPSPVNTTARRRRRATAMPQDKCDHRRPPEERTHAVEPAEHLYLPGEQAVQVVAAISPDRFGEAAVPDPDTFNPHAREEIRPDKPVDTVFHELFEVADEPLGDRYAGLQQELLGPSSQVGTLNDRRGDARGSRHSRVSMSAPRSICRPVLTMLPIPALTRTRSVR